MTSNNKVGVFLFSWEREEVVRAAPKDRAQEQITGDQVLEVSGPRRADEDSRFHEQIEKGEEVEVLIDGFL